MPVKDTDRAEFEAFHDLGFDSDGREVLVGLSYEETEWYLDILERDRSGKGRITKEEMLRRADLDDRHNAVRLQILQAWDEALFNARWGRKPWLDKAIKARQVHAGVVAMARKSSGRNNTI
jgi:hypothetical protein